jgi:hypothetical protein
MAAELLTAAASPAMECQHEAVMRLAARAGSHAQLAAAISAEEAANWLSATYNRL